MAEKDPTARLRRAVKENNLFLVKRLVQRTDQRNPDPSYQRYTSLAWAAVQGNEETFEFLLQNGHDDYECSRDVENNTILMLLADQRGALGDPHTPLSSNGDNHRAALRMATLYYERCPKTLDWTNIHGKTPLHAAALKGNEELVRVRFNSSFSQNIIPTLLNRFDFPQKFSASAWGHIPIIQLLIERGCQYSARNDEGFTASDYAYSYNTRDTLQDSARLQFELNKKSRRAIFAQAANRGSEMGIVTPNLHSEIRTRDSPSQRMRSGSGTSRTTNTSDSGEYENGLVAPHSHSSLSTSSSPSQPSASSLYHPPLVMGHTASASATFPGQLNPPANPSSALSQLASRVRERDADAMEKYMRRNRSESSSTDNKSMNGSHPSSTGPSANGDSLVSLGFPSSGSTTPKRLRPSISASHLRSHDPPLSPTPEQPEHRMRSGTGPSPSSKPWRPHQTLTRSSSISNSPLSNGLVHEQPGGFTGPPSQYAQFPEPPEPKLPAEDSVSTPTAGRRMAFHSIAKPLPGIEALTAGHKRGMSAASFRGS
ncbi:ankyrin repeat-containing domain protein [Rhodocollybia butyracea]|uniref:Ankyrin repeat-containing domain protein n=1 Tax=Rhodocollybia butyracea TaxID=206335 RepID=A0A9P5Q281_9AGAR|nr:ankyrin repeat-containing domain protein [Rhodocollybia butyracea]